MKEASEMCQDHGPLNTHYKSAMVAATMFAGFRRF